MAARRVGALGVAVGIVVTGVALMVLVFPMNMRLDTVKPCGDELSCSVPRYKSLALSLIDVGAPFNGLNRVSVPLLGTGALALGVGAGTVAERIFGRTRRPVRG